MYVSLNIFRSSMRRKIKLVKDLECFLESQGKSLSYIAKSFYKIGLLVRDGNIKDINPQTCIVQVRVAGGFSPIF